METTTKKGVHDIINSRIIDQLEKGIIPWLKNIKELPKNFISLKPYRAVNVLLLSEKNYEHPYFLSKNQAKELGGTVIENELPTPVVYWKKFDDANKKPQLRYLNLYNISQVEGISVDNFPTIPPRKNPVELCKEIVRNIPNKPDIVQNSETSFYSAKSDYIAMQPTHFFQNPEEYYSVLFHYLVQSTGNDKRLKREEYDEFFGKNPTAEFHHEKLIVGIATFILKAHCGIDGGESDKTVHSVFAYLDKLRHDKKLIVYASFRAQQAVDFILNTKPDTVQKEETL